MGGPVGRGYQMRKARGHTRDIVLRSPGES